jgi:hypothetical protein
MFGIFAKRKRFSDEEADKLNEIFRQFREGLPGTISESQRLCTSGKRDQGLELLMSCFKSGIPIVGLRYPMMLVIVSELSLRSYEGGRNGEGLHFEALRWVMHLRNLGLPDSAKRFVWSGADSVLHPDDDVRGYYAVDEGKLERMVEQGWEPTRPELMEE